MDDSSQDASAAHTAELLVFVMQRIGVQVVWSLTRLGVAERLAERPLPVSELAAATGSDTDALYRILRCAAGFGMFEELPGRRFALTPMSRSLVDEAAAGMRDLILMNGDPMFWRPYGAVLHTLRTGRPAFEQVFGIPFFDYLERNPAHAEVFHRAMTDANTGNAAALAAAVELPRAGRVADIGGGAGAFLAELLLRNPGRTGILYDRPAALAGAAGLLADRGVADRVETVAGDFHRSVPAGAGAYVLKLVLHDWPDETVVRILSRVRTAIGARGAVRVFVIERIIGEPNVSDPVKFLDIDMLVVLGGRERTVAELSALAGQAGLAADGTATAGGCSVLRFRPA